MLPVQFLGQLLAVQGLSRVAAYLSAVTGHMRNCHGLTAGPRDRSRVRIGCFTGGGVAAKGELAHFPNAHLPQLKLLRSLYCIAEARVTGTVSSENNQHSFDACDGPVKELSAFFL